MGVTGHHHYYHKVTITNPQQFRFFTICFGASVNGNGFLEILRTGHLLHPPPLIRILSPLITGTRGGEGRTGGWGDRVTNCPITMTILCESSTPAPAPHSHSHFYKSNLSINTRLRTEDGGGYSVQSALSAAPRGLLQMIREGYYLDQRRVEAGRLGTGQESISILTLILSLLWKFSKLSPFI